MDRKKSFILALLTGVCVLLPVLGMSQVFQVSEAREGVVVHEILSSGNYVLPKRNGEIIPSKPILFHWIGALESYILNFSQEFELRLPSALAAIALLGGYVCFLHSFVGGWWAGFSASTLLFSYGFYRLATDGRVDMLFCSLMSLAIFYFLDQLYRFENPKAIPSKAILFVSVLLGLAVLTKGPLALVLAGIIIAAVCKIECGIKSSTALIRWEWIVALAIPLLWYIPAAQEGGQAFIQRHLFFENIRRFSGGDGIVAKPVWFYLQHFWTQGAPWSFALLIGLLRACFGESKNHFKKLWTDREDRLSYLFRTGLVWFVVVFIFLSAANGKRRGYLLLLLPALSQMLIAFLVCSANMKERVNYLLDVRVRAVLNILGVILLSVFLALLFAPSLPFKLVADKSVTTQLTFSAIQNVSAAAPYYFWIIGAALLVAGFYFWVKSRRNNWAHEAYLGLVLFVASMFFVLLNVLISGKAQVHSYREFAGEVSQLVAEDETLHFVKSLQDESFDGFFFYFGRHVEFIDPKVSRFGEGIYLARRSWLEKNKTLASVVVEQAVGGRAIDTEDEKLVLFVLRR